MGDIHYTRDVPDGTLLLDNLAIDPALRYCLIEKKVFDRLGDYTQSMPTGASNGRIYKKNLNWRSPEGRWFIYLVVTSDQDGYVDHHPFQALVV